MIGLSVGLLTGRREIVAAIVGAGVGVAVALLSSPAVGIIVGGLVGPLVGLARPGTTRPRDGAARNAASADRFPCPAHTSAAADPERRSEGPPMSTDLIPLAFLMFLVTYPSRALGLLTPWLDRLPRIGFDYLQLVGPAILAALAAVSVMVVVSDEGTPTFHVGIEWIAVLACLAVTAWRRNLLMGLIVGRRHRGRSPGTSGSPRSRPERSAVSWLTARCASTSISTSRLGCIRPATATIVAAGRMSRNTSPWTAESASENAMSVTNIRVRTTSKSVNPPSISARSMISKIARAWPATSPGCSDAPSGPASVVPATQQLSPMTTARL